MRADLERIVWAAKCHPKIRSWKFVLLNLCHHANAAGEAYPSVSLVARETGYSAKATIQALGGLEACGIIRRRGACGDRNRVTVYSLAGLPGAVHNLSNGEVSSPLGGFNGEVSSVNGEVSSRKTGFNGEVSSVNGEVSSSRSILGNIPSVSKSVSGGANGEVTSPFVHNSAGGPSVAPSARYEGPPAAAAAPDWASLVRTPGWKPRTDLDRRACCQHCYNLGADAEQAREFVRFNGIRRWTCCDFGTVNDAAKAWVAAWRGDDPAAWRAEADRRRLERRRVVS